MSIGSQEKDKGLETEGSEGRTFACPYCSKSYGSDEKRDKCHASHFENTDSIPVRSQKRNQNRNIVDDWKKEVKK